MGVLTACWVRAEPDNRMRLNNSSIAASYDTARIFAGVGFGSTTASLLEVWIDDAEHRIGSHLK
jgi:hypothetical protein